MEPRSIAIVGAGNNIMKMGTLHALSIMRDGFRGPLYPLHPREETVAGVKAYRTPADLPEAPDLVIFIIPAPEVPPLLDKFGKIGTRRAIVITAGFRETGEDGAALETLLKQTAARHGIRFVGPNCMGIINSEIGLNTTVMPYPPRPGALGFASQSGTYVSQTLPYLKRHGIRFSKALSVGNSTDISIIDALEYLGNDAQTRAISLYVEGITDVPRFLDVARKITPHKPVLAQYVGGSSAGARSSLSHTGALAAPDHLYEGLFRQAGIIRVQSIEDLYHQGMALASQPPIKGRRVGIVTNSGGPGSAMAHACERLGFEVPRFSEALREKLRPLIPAHAPCGNPVDLTFVLDVAVLGETIPDLVMKSGEVDGVLVHGVMRSSYVYEIHDHVKDLIGDMRVEDFLKVLPDNSERLVRPPFENGIPMMMSSFMENYDDYIANYMDKGVPVFHSPEKAAAGMASLLRHLEIRGRKPHVKAVLPDRSEEADEIIRIALARGAAALDEHEAKSFLACYGIPVVDEVLANGRDEARAALEKAGFPAVMKACAPDILHKTGKGLIALNIDSVDEGLESYAAIQSAAGRPVPVIVYRMVGGARELMAGVARHEGFGPAVMFGLGGVFAEALSDTSFRSAPLTHVDALEMMNDLRSRAVLGQFRGMPAANMDALCDLLYRLGTVPLLHEEVAEVDLNPIILEGEEPVVVDALVALKKT